MKLAKLVLTFVSLSAGPLFSQMTVGPVLQTPPKIQYPPIAKAAHVTGEVVVRFSIDSDGRTVSVQMISGPLMLRSAVEDSIKNWRFQTPLPPNVQSNFEATYKFGLQTPDETLDDDLDAPPYRPCCGDVINLPGSGTQVTGEVRSIDGSQRIDVSPAPPEPPKDLCPNDKEKQVPTGSNPNDFVELFRACMKGCLDYKVRVYRDGRVEWLGRDEVAVKGEAAGEISRDAAAALMSRFESPAFWSACSVVAPTLSQDRESDEFMNGNYLTMKIGDHMKSIEAFRSAGDAGNRFVWAIDKATDTHRWIHGDPAVEPLANMSQDIEMPKPGMTALIRSTFHFSQTNAEQTLDALKRLLAAPGIDVEAADASGWTPLMYAATLTTDDRAIGMLLDANANANGASLHGDTALMMAAYEGRLSERLLKAGADINAQNADGVTVLMFLAQRMVAEELKDALDAGADVTAQDRSGRTALDYLRAASCDKAIVSLPKPWLMIVYKEPPPCPSNSEEYKKSETVLRNAMKKKLRR